MNAKRIAIVFAALVLILALAGVSWAVTDIVNANETKTYEYAPPSHVAYTVTPHPPIVRASWRSR